MATFHINRTGTTLGTFSEDEVREGLRAGKFLGTDLGWREGMAQWQPLAQFSEFATASEVPGAPPLIPPPGSQIPMPPVVTPRSGLPWDERHTRGFFSAFADTMMMVLTRPSEAFTVMKREGGLGEPLIYALIGGSVGALFYCLFAFFLPSLGNLGGHRNPLLNVFGAGIGFFFLIIFIPLGVALGAFIGSAILHLCLMIVGGAKQSFETTFRVVCFSIGSVDPLLIIPFCGGPIVAVWRIVLHCIGLARAHETDTGRAVLAVFLPLVVCCGAAFLLAILFGGIGALSQHSH